MNTYNLIDKNSDMVITISANNEEEAKQEAFKRINQGDVAKEYSTYSNLSTFMVIIQLGVLYKYLTDELLIGKGGPTNKTMLIEALRSRLASVTYLLTLGNMMIASVMTIILRFFSTDG